MPNIPELKIGNTTYDLHDKRVDVLKSALNDDENFARANPNISAGVNCFDIERWLTEIGATHSYENGVHTFYVNGLQANPYVFSDEDIDFTFYCDMTIIDGSRQCFVFYDKNGTEVARYRPGYGPIVFKGSSVKMDYGTKGTVTVQHLSLINNNLSNSALSKSVNFLGGALVKETRGENIMNFDEYLDLTGAEYTKNGDTYNVNVSASVLRLFNFSPSDIPVVLSAGIEYGTGTGIVIYLLDTNGNVVNTLTKYTKSVKAVASKYEISYGNSGTATFINPKIEIDYNSLSDSAEKGIRERTANMMPVPTPEGFSWVDNPVAGHLFTDGKGNFVLKNFDVADYKNQNASGVDYYVNPLVGSDTAYNGLTEKEPFKTVSKAYSMPNVRTIYMMPGIYGRNESIWGCNTITKDVNFVGFGGDVIITNDWAFGEWSAEGHTNVIKKTTSIVPERIVDVLRKNEEGNYINLVQKSTLAEVYATQDSFISSDGVLYAHVSGQNYPEWVNVVCVKRNDSNVSIDGGCSVYLEGLKVIGGSTPIRAQATDSTHAPSIYAKECEFWYGQGDASYRNAVTMRGTRLCIFQRCKALYNGGTDGFNYHTYQDIVPKAVEIECQGLYNGGANDGNDQGSTAHEGVKVIRINGLYAFNYGANIGDEGIENATTDETETWNLGCVCHNSQSAYGAQHGNFMSYFNAKMWIDGCVGYSSQGNLAGNLTNVKLRYPQFIGDLKASETTGDPQYY